MTKGVMVRGYISRGNILHKGNHIIGTGYQNTMEMEKEKRIKAFRFPLDKTSTPFVEIDQVVVEYIRGRSDRCVQEVYKDLVKEDENGIAVIFPFWKLSNLAGSNIMNAEECNKSLQVVREWIRNFLET